MSNQNIPNINTIFVDCFDTIIFRKIKAKEVFKIWAKQLADNYNIPWKDIYKTYTKTNFNMCFKKIFKSFTLQENFNIVIKKVYEKLKKKYPSLVTTFIDDSVNKYVQTELDNFVVNCEMIDFLNNEKKSGKKIYLVSDFYCKSDIFKKWFTELKIIETFDKLFSSSDFDKEKATTKLYKHLIQLLQVNPKTTIMYGDNPWSDVLMAKSCKLNAKRVRQTLQRINHGKR